jgi:hypothetical protein
VTTSHDGTSVPRPRSGEEPVGDELAALLGAWRAELDVAASLSRTATPPPAPVRRLHADGRWRRRSVTFAIAAGVFAGSTGVAAAVVHPGGALGLLRTPFGHTSTTDAGTTRARALLEDAAGGVAAARAAGGISADGRRAVAALLDEASALLGHDGPARLRHRLDVLRQELAQLPGRPATDGATPSAPAVPQRTATPAPRAGDGPTARPGPAPSAEETSSDDSHRPGTADLPRTDPRRDGGGHDGSDDGAASPWPGGRNGGEQGQRPQPAPSPEGD